MKALNDIRNDVVQGQTKSALAALLKVAKEMAPDAKDLFTSISGLSGRYAHLQMNRIQGNISSAEGRTVESQIIVAILDLADMIEGRIPNPELQETVPDQKMTQRIRILFFSANPMGQGQLKLDTEIREIEAALSRAKLRDKFEFIPALATRPKDFMRRILEVKPQMVHFSGHGAPGGVYMLDDNGKAVPVPENSLADAFEIFKDEVSCVVLNACFSGTQAQQIRRHIPNVVGTKGLVEDECAILFAEHFYTAIGQGEPVPRAFEFASRGVGLDSRCRDVFFQA